MEKNYTGQALSLAILVLILLAGLSLLPGGMTLGDLQLRKMDIFADVRDSVLVAASDDFIDAPPPDSTAYFAQDSNFNIFPDSTAAAIQADSIRVAPMLDSIYFGNKIENYSFDQSGLDRFFEAVDSISMGRTVRVAWYGDSFVEGDILVGDLRDSLQTAWGGAGVGFVPITSEVAQFKRSLKHRFNDWYAHSIVKKTENRPKLGVNGYAYSPGPEAMVQYEGASYFKHTQRWSQVLFFYSSDSVSSLVWQAKNSPAKFEKLPAKPSRLSTWFWKGNQSSTDGFTFQFSNTSGLTAYGASLESGPGIYIDNFSIRGNSGGPLKLLEPAFVRQFDAVLRYDLIVLQVGLNAVTNSLTNIKWYEAELDRTFKHLKNCFPGKPILVVSVGDRGAKVGTEIGTMQGVPAIVKMQRNLARKHGLLFFDLFWGMGGPNTMVRFAYNRPRLANTDYTHLTHEGGKVVGAMFAKLFLKEQTDWRKGRKPQ
ncbi:MAG: GDSL-type esterase/lipase family protein [Saprospiraceae bacterium]